MAGGVGADPRSGLVGRANELGQLRLAVRQDTNRRVRGMVERLRRPGTLLVVAVVCLVSAFGNGRYDDDFSNVATIVFGVLGSLFLTAVIVRAATSRSARPPRIVHRPGSASHPGENHP